MTFQEYLNQENPVKNPKVLLTMEDLYNVWTINLKMGKVHTVHLLISGEIYEYQIVEGDSSLWTTDHDGKKKSRSCFMIENFIEPTRNP